MLGLVDGAHDERVAVDVLVVGDDVEGGGRVLGQGDGVVLRVRVVVDGNDRDGERRRVFAAVSVPDGVDDRVGADEVDVGRIDDGRAGYRG